MSGPAVTPRASFDTLAARLVAAAHRIVLARANELARERKRDPRRWRDAGLLWPLFAKD